MLSATVTTFFDGISEDQGVINSIVAGVQSYLSILVDPSCQIKLVMTTIFYVAVIKCDKGQHNIQEENK